jgi:hypothetical protein
MEVVRS